MALGITRKVDQGIVLQTSDDDIYVKVSEIQGKQVHLAILAPKAVRIYRSPEHADSLLD